MTVRTTRELTPAEAGSLLLTAFPASRLLAAEPLAGGHVSSVMALHRDGDGDLVAKAYPAELGWKLENELLAYGLLAADPTLPVPRVLASGSPGTVLDRGWALMSRLPGVPLSSVSSTLSVEGLSQGYTALGGLLCRIHATHLPFFGHLGRRPGETWPTARAYADRQFAELLRWHAELDGPAGDRELLSSALGIYATLLDSPPLASLCHGDGHEGNVLVSRAAAGWGLTGLVDFENAVAGDPLADLAKFRCWAVLGDADKDRALLTGYGLENRDRKRLALWGLYYALDSWCWYAAHGRAGFLPPLRAEAGRRASELED